MTYREVERLVKKVKFPNMELYIKRDESDTRYVRIWGQLSVIKDADTGQPMEEGIEGATTLLLLKELITKDQVYREVIRCITSLTLHESVEWIQIKDKNEYVKLCDPHFANNHATLQSFSLLEVPNLHLNIPN